ncbi:hypothetical protein [Winogradskyella vidalii]|uniref:hypothetical protein n=1 Tax=Winogradskyella vidalii TaxID=2615024 RepID=UPI0015CA4861|nr:hypothetical protein [Winogradskyella vidalii]
MILHHIALYSWNTGVVMIAIFALVCIALVGILINFLMGGKPKDVSESIDASNNLGEENNTENIN